MCPAPVLSVPVGSLADVALALYRKYRPAKFAEVVGQEHVTEPLSTALASGRINHAYLFSGPRGCGKTSSARILARSLNCEQGPTPDPCGVCASCVSLAPGGPAVRAGQRRGGCGIRTREGLHPTRFPSVRHRPLGESSASELSLRAAAVGHRSMLSHGPRAAPIL